MCSIQNLRELKKICVYFKGSSTICIDQFLNIFDIFNCSVHCRPLLFFNRKHITLRSHVVLIFLLSRESTFNVIEDHENFDCAKTTTLAIMILRILIKEDVYYNLLECALQQIKRYYQLLTLHKKILVTFGSTHVWKDANDLRYIL